jgi:PAS domain S-box-containing protein
VQVGGIGIYETDFEQDLTRFSPELCIILGLPAGTEMSYAEASRLFHEQDRATVDASVEAARTSADEGKWSGVHQILRADGAVRWVSIHGRRHYRDTTKGRQAVRSIGTVIDITHLKEAEAALHQSELRLRLALEAAQMGTFEADTTGSEAIIDAQEARLLDLPEDTRIVSADELRAAHTLRGPASKRCEAGALRSSKVKHIVSTSFAFACWMGPSAGSAVMQPSGQPHIRREFRRHAQARGGGASRKRDAPADSTSGAALGVFEGMSKRIARSGSTTACTKSSGVHMQTEV